MRCGSPRSPSKCDSDGRKFGIIRCIVVSFLLAIDPSLTNSVELNFRKIIIIYTPRYVCYD
jgi:hypothetical protein